MFPNWCATTIIDSTASGSQRRLVLIALQYGVSKLGVVIEVVVDHTSQSKYISVGSWHLCHFSNVLRLPSHKLGISCVLLLLFAIMVFLVGSNIFASASLVVVATNPSCRQNAIVRCCRCSFLQQIMAIHRAEENVNGLLWWIAF